MEDKAENQKSEAVLKPSDFVHLHNHTHHSLLDGLTKVNELVDKVKEFGMEAVAMTDHGTMSGVIELYKLAGEAGIKPILGMEAYVAARSRFDTDPAKDKVRYHLTVLAMNNQGYQNLMAISSKASLEGFYYKPRIDRELLEKHNEGLIILSGCAGGEVADSLRNDDYKKAKEIAKWYKTVFGDRYHLELQDHGHPDGPSPWEVQTKINEGLLKLSKDLKIDCVVTCDGHYLNHEDQEAHEILLCVGTGSYLSDEKRMSLKEFELHLTDPKDIIARWGKSHPEIIFNTKKIADRCQVEIELGKILIPKFPVPDNETEKSYLDRLVYQGMANRYTDLTKNKYQKMSNQEIRKHLTKEQIERLDMEFSVLEKMGYNGYFLIVQDFINWGKSKGIIFGPGRGSAAGSIIAYALNITDLDPLEYELLFERFLNPDRISMPDIDIDIQDTRRNEVIEYCSEKYGAERVTNIGTFGKMAAKAAVRDVARVLEVPYAEADRMAKLIPMPNQGRYEPLAKILQNDADLKKEYDTNPEAKRVFDFAMRLEGTIRSHGVHAAGVVIAPDDVVKFVPVEMAQKGVVATQFPMGPVEEIGLLKMDFLGLSNLTIINNAMRIIKKVYGKKIDLATLPLDDKKTYELFQRGDTTGVFQLESAGMKRYLRELKPERFDDIIAMVALYRPGPMQFIDSFIKRKHGEEKISYLHQGLENSLKNTYGILVYQEQFMQISKEWCGFSGGQADTLRKAVGKKKMDMMVKIKPEFVDGAINHGGASKDLAETFWDQLVEFANYCFNKSHAACYGLIAYQTAYLKAHYPDAFMAALMTSDQDDVDRLAIEIAECQHSGITVLPPDVNQSYTEFAIVPNENKIRFGMSAVKNVGQIAVDEVLRAREEGGRFESVGDFARRVSNSKFNRKAWEALIRAGAFDQFNDRSDLLFNLDTIVAYASRSQKEANSNQASLFGEAGESAADIVDLKLDDAPEKYSERETLKWERELLGLYLSAHPLDKYDDYFAEQTVAIEEIQVDHDGKKAMVGGVLSSFRAIVTKSGSKMAFLKIEDKTGDIEVIVFPKSFEEIGDKLEQDVVLRISGRISGKDQNGNAIGEPKVIADEVIFITDEELENYQKSGKKMKKLTKTKKKTEEKTKNSDSETKEEVVYRPDDKSSKKLFIHVKNPDDHVKLTKLKSCLNKHDGENEIILVLGNEEKKSALRLPFRADANDSLLEEIRDIYDKDCVVLK